jgi:PadR family transcriptional regulator
MGSHPGPGGSRRRRLRSGSRIEADRLKRLQLRVRLRERAVAAAEVDNSHRRSRTSPACIALRSRTYNHATYGDVAARARFQAGQHRSAHPGALDERQRHGYESSQLFEERSNGTITFHTTSLYPTLYRLAERGLIEGRWVERAEERRRRYYHVTRAGRKALTKQRSTWDTFFLALDGVARIRHA